MTNRTAAEDRALLAHVAALRRVKLTFNEDEIWVLYRLLVEELRAGTPSLFPETDAEYRHAAGMALAKLSSAVMDLGAPKEQF